MLFGERLQLAARFWQVNGGEHREFQFAGNTSEERQPA